MNLAVWLICRKNHATRYDYYYWRRVRVGKDESMYRYLSMMHPELLEDDYFRPETTSVIKVPQKAPDDGIIRTESALDTLTRVKYMHENWISAGHTKGINRNNVSCTINIREYEWKEVGEWLWDNRNTYTGISVLPYDNGSYIQPPFEPCTKKEYEEAMKYLGEVNLEHIVEEQDNTNLQGEVACTGGACEVKYL
jgi:ribonucleoside-diphosphate reductase alpha chain